MFGADFNLTPPATFSVPAGSPVSVGSGIAVEGWQSTAYRLYDLVGALHYPTTRLSRQTSQLEWRVWVNGRELGPDAAKREMDGVTAGLGPEGATYLLSLNDMIGGEVWYVQNEPDRFEVYAVVEKDIEKKIERARSGGRIAIRMHQPHPADPTKPDSSVRTAIGPAEELLTLQSLSEAQARSRLSQAGVIVTPVEQLYAAEDPWEQNLVTAMSKAIQNVKDPSALAPIHVRMRRDLIEFVRYITFPRPYDDLIDRKIERAVTSIANALDIEPELLQGLGDSTYWNAWAVSMDTYQAHIAPRAERIGNLYADVAQRLRANMGQNVVVEIVPDPRIMLARRSSVRDAMDAFKLYTVGPKYVRDAIGATEADAPTAEEMEWMERVLGSGGTMDRERRVGENPGPARSNPENASVSDYDVALYARQQLGFKLRDAWRNTPHRNRLSGIEAPDFSCYVPRSDIDRELGLDGGVEGIILTAVAEVADPTEVSRLASWILKTLDTPTSMVKAMEEVNA
jgi:hypothetical protein